MVNSHVTVKAAPVASRHNVNNHDTRQRTSCAGLWRLRMTHPLVQLSHLHTCPRVMTPPRWYAQEDCVGSRIVLCYHAFSGRSTTLWRESDSVQQPDQAAVKPCCLQLGVAPQMQRRGHTAPPFNSENMYNLPFALQPTCNGLQPGGLVLTTRCLSNVASPT